MQFKKIILFSFFITLYTSTHPMEVIKSTLQEHALPIAINMGIGAIGGATHASLINKINNDHNLKHKASGAEMALYGALGSLAIYVPAKIGPFLPLSTIEICMLTTVNEFISTGFMVYAYLAGIKSIRETDIQDKFERNFGPTHRKTKYGNRLNKEMQNTIRFPSELRIITPVFGIFMAIWATIGKEYITNKYFSNT